MPHSEIADSHKLLSELETWVRIETPTTEPARVNALMDVAASQLIEAGAEVVRIPGIDPYGDNLIARINPRAGVKPILVAGHLDTVWPAGTLASMPFRVEGEHAHGPGIFDMKAGSFAAFYAVRAIARQRHSDEAADHVVAHARRGGRQPDQPRDHRARGGGRGAGADPGTGGPAWRLRHRAQGRGPIQAAYRRRRLARRRRIIGRRLGGGGTRAPDPEDPGISSTRPTASR